MQATRLDRYGMRVSWSDADQGYIAVFPEVPGISGFGETADEALAELRDVLQAVVEVYREGEPLSTRPARTARSAGPPESFAT